VGKALITAVKLGSASEKARFVLVSTRLCIFFGEAALFFRARISAPAEADFKTSSTQFSGPMARQNRLPEIRRRFQTC